MKKTVVLDIDRTLVHSVEKYRLNHEWKDKFEWFDVVSHITFLRPHVREFINFLFDKGYNVAIFTAGGMEYAEEVVKELFKVKKPSFIFVDKDYDKAFKLYGKLKAVEYVEDKVKGECILIDDSNTINRNNPEKCYRIQPFFVCFDDIPNFNVESEKDTGLLECMKWLEENYIVE